MLLGVEQIGIHKKEPLYSRNFLLYKNRGVYRFLLFDTLLYITSISNGLILSFDIYIYENIYLILISMIFISMTFILMSILYSIFILLIWPSTYGFFYILIYIYFHVFFSYVPKPKRFFLIPYLLHWTFPLFLCFVHPSSSIFVFLLLPLSFVFFC